MGSYSVGGAANVTGDALIGEALLAQLAGATLLKCRPIARGDSVHYAASRHAWMLVGAPRSFRNAKASSCDVTIAGVKPISAKVA